MAEGEVTPSAALHLFVSLIVLVNPALAVPVFLNLTTRCASAQRRRIAVTAALTAMAIFAVSALAGAAVLTALSITIDALRAAGGVLLTLMAIDLLWPRGASAAAPPEDSPAQSPAVVPIGFPLLAGPGSIAVVIAAAATYPGWEAHALVLLVIAVIALVALAALLLAVPIYRLLGDTGLDVLSRLMAMVLLGVGIQMLVVGLGGLLPGLMK